MSVDTTQQDPGLDLLVWDAPNIDMTLSQVIGTRPGPSRVRDSTRWAVARAHCRRRRRRGLRLRHSPENAVNMRGWVETLRAFGFAVFAKPKLQPADDVDDAMLDHIWLRAGERDLRRVVVASGDGRNFRAPSTSSPTRASRSSSSPSPRSRAMPRRATRSVPRPRGRPGVFVTPLNRTRLDSLPPGGCVARPDRLAAGPLKQDQERPPPLRLGAATACRNAVPMPRRPLEALHLASRFRAPIMRTVGVHSAAAP